MGLVAWYPLNGDYTNLGYERNLKVSSSGTMADGSKIGLKSLKLVSDSGQTCVFNSTVSNTTFNDTYINNKSFSYSIWYKSSGMGTGMNIAGLFGTTYGVRCNIDSYGKIMCLLSTGSSSTTLATSVISNIFDNKWHHVVMTVKNNGDETTTCAVYFDGSMQGTKTAAFSYTTKWSNTALHIGNDTNASTYKLNGQLSDFRFYDTAISEKEVGELYKSCILHYNFNLSTIRNNQIHDCSGYGHTGTLVSNGTSVASLVESSTVDTKLLGEYSFYNNPSSETTSSTTDSFLRADVALYAPEEFSILFHTKISSYGKQNSGLFAITSSSSASTNPSAYTTNPVAQYDNNFRVNVGSEYQSITGVASLLPTGAVHHAALVFNSSTLKFYVDGVLKMTKTYTTPGATLSLRHLFLGLDVARGVYRNSNIYVSDFKIFSTALSEADVKEEYRSHTQFANDESIFSHEFIEEGDNKLELSNLCIARKNKTYNGVVPVEFYTQTNCQGSMVEDGYRVYRPADLKSASSGGTNNMYGGIKVMFQNIGNHTTATHTNTSTGETQTYTKSDSLVKGHRYLLSFHVKGFSNNATDFYAITYNMGWESDSALNASPINVVSSGGLPANFGIVDGEAVGDEKDLFYIFTINDDIYKVCAKTYSSFVLGNIYPSYREFKIGYSYHDTGEFGTDLIFSDFKLEDITDNPDDYRGDIKRNGTVVAKTFMERGYDTTHIQLSDGGTITSREIHEE